MISQLALSFETTTPTPADPYEELDEAKRIATEEALDNAICDNVDLKERLTARDDDIDDLKQAMREGIRAIQRIKDAITNDQLSLPGIQSHLGDIQHDLELAVEAAEVE